jgi:hypothetical protein
MGNLTAKVVRLFHPSHQIARCDFVGLRKPNNCSQSGTLQSSFEGAQYCTIYTKFDEYIHLRKSRLFPNLPQHIAEGPFRA